MGLKCTVSILPNTTVYIIGRTIMRMWEEQSTFGMLIL